MRYFGGLSVDETAEALHVSPDTVKRDWRFAKYHVAAIASSALIVTASTQGASLM